MNRRDFAKLLSGLLATPVVGHAQTKQLLSALNAFPNTPQMPALFLGHGSPMNAITDTEFSRGFQKVAKDLPRPHAILCISAHWQSQGSWLTAMPKPRTIHDFGGFPQALHEFQYPADGSTELAKLVHTVFKQNGVDARLDYSEWGLDHGTWSVLTHLFPQADVPVVQLSLDYFKTAQEHYDLAKQLNQLRSKGILIVGSGNTVHNLRMLAGSDNQIFGFDWALEADAKMKQFIQSGDHQSLIQYEKQGKAFQLAIPTPEHYLPMLYVLAQQDKKESLQIFNDKPVEGSIVMTSVAIGV